MLKSGKVAIAELISNVTQGHKKLRYSMYDFLLVVSSKLPQPIFILHE